MGYDGTNELQNELDKIKNMSPYDRLSYIRELVEFHRQIEDFSEATINGLYERLMYVTKGYEQR